MILRRKIHHQSRKERNVISRNGYIFLGEVDFKERFRFTKEGIQQLLLRVGRDLEPQTARNHALSAQQKLLLALRFYASGDRYYTDGDSHRISKTTVCKYVHEVTDVLLRRILPEEVVWPPGPTAKEAIGECFYDIASMPNVCGCIDGTLITIKAPYPREIEPQFVNWPGKHSIYCMAVCGPEMQFYFASANWPGAANDARVLRNSSLDQKFCNGWRPFPGGDSGYPLKEWLQTSILSPKTTKEIEKFNPVHRKMRRLIECAFGILKQRFLCLLYCLRVNPKRAGQIFMVCTALHNLLLREQPPDVKENDGIVLNGFHLEQEAESESDGDDQDASDREKGLKRRNQLVEFMSKKPGT